MPDVDIELMEEPAVKNPACSVIFITAASATCTPAARRSQRRLRLHHQAGILQAAAPFARTLHAVPCNPAPSRSSIRTTSMRCTTCTSKQQFSSEPSARRTETNTLELVQALFIAQPAVAHAVEDVVEGRSASARDYRPPLSGILRRHPSSCGWEMLYGNIGHPRRLWSQGLRLPSGCHIRR
ncbi:hypothetical protein M8494_01285 [Serratia ureilytica]